MKSCLIVIDVQESFRRHPCFTATGLAEYIAAQNTLIEGCQAKQIPAVRVLHADGPDTPENPFAIASGPVRPSQGLMDFEATATLTKSRRSALVGTGLDVWRIRQGQGIGKLIASGIRTEQCSETTAQHASDLGWKVDFVTEATHTWDRELPDDQVLNAQDIKTRTATALQGRFANLCTAAQALQP